MIAVVTEYQISDPVKTVRRPKRSATWPNASVPTHSPAKVAKTKTPKPATFKTASEANTPSDSGLNSPEAIMPGAT